MATVTIAPGENDERVLNEDEITSQSWEKTHTGVATFTVKKPYEPELDSRFFDEIHLEEGSEFLFRGFILSVESNKGSATTTISGKGIAWELTNTETTFSVANEFAHDAIERFWNNETAFSPTVTTPTPQTTVTGKSVQQASTNSEFSNILTLADKTAAVIRDDNVELAQTSFTQEGEADPFGANTRGDGNYSGGEATFIERGAVNNGDSTQLSFNLDYTIPKNEVGIKFRTDPVDGSGDGIVDVPEFTVKIDGNVVGTEQLNTNNLQLKWRDFGFDVGFELTAGSHTLTVEVTGDTQGTLDDELRFDLINIHDERFPPNFDNTNDGSGGYLDGPENYPIQGETVEFDAVFQDLNITDGTLNTSFDDTSGDQRIQLLLDSTWFPNDGSENNTESVTTDFGNEIGRNIQGRATLDAYGTTTGQTPLQGVNGQKIQSWEILIDGNDLILFEDRTFEGSKFEIAQRLHIQSDMRFSIDHAANSKNVDSFQVGDVSKTLPALDIINETIKKDVNDYANHVTVRGVDTPTGRFTSTESNQTEINTYGQVHADKFNPELATQKEVDEVAKSFLEEKLRELVLKGTLEVAPVDVRPGFTYPNPFDSSENDVPIEEVRYRESAGQIRGQLIFDFRAEALSEELGGLRQGQNDNFRGF